MARTINKISRLFSRTAHYNLEGGQTPARNTFIKARTYRSSRAIPDYPPMLFRYKGKVHNIKKSDGPERIEREWWLEEGEHRDYYCVEDEEGHRYWVFRSGHYSEKKIDQWFIYGFFA